MKQALTQCAVKESNLQPNVSYSSLAGGEESVSLCGVQSNTDEDCRKAAEPRKPNDNKTTTGKDRMPGLRRPRLSALSRRQLPNGLDSLAHSETCDLGCGRPAEGEIADVKLCGHHLELVAEIEADAVTECWFAGRSPLTVPIDLRAAS